MSMGNRHFVEQGALVESKVSEGIYPIRLITEGKGSSGVYSRELLQEYKDVFANRPMFMNHPKDPNKPWERDVTTIAARLGEQIEYKEVDGVAGLYSTATVDKRWREFVDNYGDVIGVSVFIAGESREENGEYIVESFDPTDAYSSVDFVVAAGRGGRVERMLESYRQVEASVTSADALKKKENNTMELQELADKVIALTTLVESFITESKDAATAGQAQKVTVEEALTAYRTVAKSIEDADLFPSQRESLLAEAAKGVDVTERITEAAKVKAEAVTVLTESAPTGRVITGSTSTIPASSVVPKGW